MQGEYRSAEQLREELSQRYNAPDWKFVRLAVFRRDKFRCQTPNCGATKNLRCHHRTYEHFWDEMDHLDDLVTQCKSCHEKGAYGDDKIRMNGKALYWLSWNPVYRILWTVAKFLGVWVWKIAKVVLIILGRILMVILWPFLMALGVVVGGLVWIVASPFVYLLEPWKRERGPEEGAPPGYFTDSPPSPEEKLKERLREAQIKASKYSNRTLGS